MTPPSRKPSCLAALAVSLWVIAIQLWLLLVSFDLYVRGYGGRIWSIGVTAGLVFAGGLVILWALHRQATPAKR